MSCAISKLAKISWVRVLLNSVKADWSVKLLNCLTCSSVDFVASGFFLYRERSIINFTSDMLSAVAFTNSRTKKRCSMKKKFSDCAKEKQ